MDEIETPIEMVPVSPDMVAPPPPADLARMWTLLRIAVAIAALVFAGLLARAQHSVVAQRSGGQVQALLNARSAAVERDEAIAERNAAIAELEELRAEAPAAGSTVMTARLAGYLDQIDVQAKAARALLVNAPEPDVQQAGAQIDAMRMTLGQAQSYLLPPTPAPTPKPGAGDDGAATPHTTPTLFEGGARLRPIPANLVVPDAPSAAAPAAEPPAALPPEALRVAPDRSFLTTILLGIVAALLLTAIAMVFVTRDPRLHRWGNEAIKLLLGVSVGMAATLFVAF